MTVNLGNTAVVTDYTKYSNGDNDIPQEADVVMTTGSDVRYRGEEVHLDNIRLEPLQGIVFHWEFER